MDRLLAERAGSAHGRVVYWDHPVTDADEIKHADGSDGYGAFDRDAAIDQYAAIALKEPLHGGFFMVFQLLGRGTCQQGGQEWLLDEGDVALCWGEKPKVSCLSGGRQRLFSFDQPDQSPSARKLFDQLPLVLSGDGQAGQLLARLTTDIHAATGGLSGTLKEQFLANLLSMVSAALPAQPSPKAECASRLTLFHLERIKEYMMRHLRNPKLCVRGVSTALDISPSHVHRVFHHAGCTFSEWLWNCRLEACARDMSNTQLAHLGVGQIALSWGYNDTSHFSRSFRQRYGQSPRAWRAQQADADV